MFPLPPPSHVLFISPAKYSNASPALPPRVSFSLIIHEVSKQNGEEARRSIQIIPEQTSADSLNCSICLPKIRQFILISGE